MMRCAPTRALAALVVGAAASLPSAARTTVSDAR